MSFKFYENIEINDKLTVKVEIFEDEAYWYVNGLSVRYLAYSPSYEESKENFILGLRATIENNIQRFGNADKIMIPGTPINFD